MKKALLTIGILLAAVRLVMAENQYFGLNYDTTATSATMRVAGGIWISSSATAGNYKTYKISLNGRDGSVSVATHFHSSGTVKVAGAADTIGEATFGASATKSTITATGNASFAGFIKPDSLTAAEINVLDPGVAGETYYCSDCTNATTCSSTGAAVGQFAGGDDRTTGCD